MHACTADSTRESDSQHHHLRSAELSQRCSGLVLVSQLNKLAAAPESLLKNCNCTHASVEATKRLR